METITAIIPKERELRKNLVKIINSGRIPQQFDTYFLEDMGFNNSESILYIRLFLNLGLIKLDGRPTLFYQQFIRSVPISREIMAIAVYQSYSVLFDIEPNIDRLPRPVVLSKVRELFAPTVSNTYVKKATATFLSLVGYADKEKLHGLKRSKKIKKINIEREPATVHDAFLVELLKGDRNHAYHHDEPFLSNSRFSEIRELVGSIDSAQIRGIAI